MTKFNPHLLDIHRQDEEGITILKRCLDFDNKDIFRYLSVELQLTEIWKEPLIFDKIARTSWGGQMMEEICSERLCRNPEYLNILFNVLEVEKQKDLFVKSKLLCKMLGDKTFLEILENQGDTKSIEDLATMLEKLVGDEKEAFNLIRPAMNTSAGLTKVLKIVKSKYPKCGWKTAKLFGKFLSAVKSFVGDFVTDVIVATTWFGYHTAMMGEDMTPNLCSTETYEDLIPFLQGASWDCNNTTFTIEQKANCIYNATNQIQLKTKLKTEECKMDQKYLMDSVGWGILFTISVLTVTLPLMINCGRNFHKRLEKKSPKNSGKCCTSFLFYLTTFFKSALSEIYIKFEVLMSNRNLLKIECTPRQKRIEEFKVQQPAEFDNKDLEKKEKEDFDERKITAKEKVKEIESEDAEILYITISMETYIQFFLQSLVTLFPAFLLALVTYFKNERLFSNFEKFSSEISSSIQNITIESVSLIFSYINICKLKMREKNKSFSPLINWKTLGCVLLYSTCDIVLRIASTGLLAFLLSPTHQFLWWVAILVYLIHTGLMVILHFAFTSPKNRNGWAIILNAMSSFYTFNRPIRPPKELDIKYRHKSKLQENLSKICVSILLLPFFMSFISVFSLIVLLENIICIVVGLTAGTDTIRNQYGSKVLLDSRDKGVVAIFLTLITLLGWGFRFGYYKFHPASPEISKENFLKNLCYREPRTEPKVIIENLDPENLPLMELSPANGSIEIKF